MADQPKPAFGVGSFCWSEHSTRDFKKSQDFYGKVLGWKFEPWGGPGQYWIIKAGDKMVAGMMDINNPEFAHMPNNWGYYIDVANVEETAGRVPRLGGKVLNPVMEVPEVGKMCPIQDPTGAVVSIITPNEHAKEPPCADPGCFLWVELMARGFNKARAFYSELIGWKTEEMPMPNGVYTLFQAKNGNAGGGMETPPDVPKEVPSYWCGYIHVTDVDATAAKVEKNGGRVFFPPMDIPNVGRFTQIEDPTGAVVSIMTPSMPG